MLGEHGAGAIPAIEQLGRGFHKSLWLITFGVLLLCIGEMIYAHAAASSYLLKDGAEWAYDVAYFGLAAISFGRGETTERRAAFALAAILGIGGCQGLYEIWSAITAPATDEIDNLTISAVVTILGSFAEAAVLFRFRRSHDPIVEATWLSARNSALTSALGAGVTFVVRMLPNRWAQIAVDALGVYLAFQAAAVVVKDARKASAERIARASS